MVWACIEKRTIICGQVRCRGKEGEEDRSGGGWITSGTTCRRESCQGGSARPGYMKETSAPHRWERMQNKKMKNATSHSIDK